MTPDGEAFRLSRRRATKLVRQGQAEVICYRPYTVRLVDTVTVWGALMPDSCRRFRSDFITTKLKNLTGKPLSAQDPEYLELQEKIAGYAPVLRGEIRRQVVANK